MQSALISSKGLSAIEYLLFHTGKDNACAPEGDINAKGTWAALDEAELLSRKLALAHVLAVDTVANAATLVDAWDPAKGNFLGELSSPTTSKAFGSEQMAFNAVTDAMFYLDLQVKNDKVGKPMGLVLGCSSPPCPSLVESPYAHASKSHIRQNVRGYDALYHGCPAQDGGAPGLGLRHLLVAVGAEATAVKVDASLTEIDASLDALGDDTFEADLANDAAGVTKLFEALRSNAAIMKADVVTVLDLELPKKVEGDND